jgi:hypothetical protein
MIGGAGVSESGGERAGRTPYFKGTPPIIPRIVAYCYARPLLRERTVGCALFTGVFDIRRIIGGAAVSESYDPLE